MFNKFKMAATLVAATLSLTACSSEYEPDTSLPLHEQIQESGVASYAGLGFIEDSDWDQVAFGVCNYEFMWTDDTHTEYSTTFDEAMISMEMDDVWDEKDRKTIARILVTNKCPSKLKELS